MSSRRSSSKQSGATGGIVGKVTNVTDDFLTLEVADNIMLNFQKSSISAALPKGTVKAIK